MQRKPVKRSEQLTPLSREHHDALLFVWKLNEGLKKNIEVDRIRNYVSWFWENHLKHHFREEERLLLPKFPKQDPLAEQLFTDHENIRRLLSGEIDHQAIAELAKDLNDHVRFEERIFFPHAEERLTTAELDEIFTELEKSPHCTDGWNDQFWLANNS